MISYLWARLGFVVLILVTACQPGAEARMTATASPADVKGDVFMEAKILYKALDNGADYNSFDWSVFVKGQIVDSPAFVINGPKPDLGSGSLPTGRTAEGWIVYEVPGKGDVILSYSPNYQGPPVFEIVVRAS